VSQAAFDERVDAYARSPTHREGPTLDLTRELSQARSGDLVLDVSTGTGFTAHALAAQSTRVVAADIAPNMLRHTRATAPSALQVVQTDTHALAFPHETFDIVTCRHAFHHYLDGNLAMLEMARVVRMGGRVVIADTISPDDAEVAETMHAIELARDPSHICNRYSAQVRTLMTEVGLVIERAVHTSTEQDFDSWCGRTGVSDALRAQLWRDFNESAKVRAAFNVRETPTARRFDWPVLVAAGVRRA
jgi:2-polyprenyl-3-methyl-5-hydroxy-6-metoxy-1,4-benzoquinol methylase